MNALGGRNETEKENVRKVVKDREKRFPFPNDFVVEQILQRCPVASDGRFVYKKVSSIGEDHYYGKWPFLSL